MSIIDNIKSLWTKSVSVTTGAMDSIIGVRTGSAHWSAPSYQSFIDAYRTNPYVYRSVEYLAANAAAVPWRVILAGEEVREGGNLDSHPVLELLRHPSPGMTGSKLIKRVVEHILLYGSAYLYINKPGEAPVELNVLRPDLMRPKLGPWGEAVSYDYGYGRNVQNIPASDVLAFVESDPQEPDKGLSAACPAWRSIQLFRSAVEHNKSLLDNEARISGAFISKTPLTRDQKERLQSKARAFEGAVNAGKTAVLDGNLSFQPMSWSPAEMGYETLQTISAREIATSFGVPSQVLGLPEAATWSNYEQARITFIRFTLIPLVDYIKDTLQTGLVQPNWQGVRLEPDYTELPELAEDKSEVEHRVRENFRAGIITRDEAREALGYAPEPPASDQQETE